MLVLFPGCVTSVTGTSIEKKITPPLPSNFGDKGSSAGKNESEIIVQRPAGSILPKNNMNIYIDGQIRLTLLAGEDGMTIVPNGTHNIHAELYDIKSEIVSFDATSSRINFAANAYQEIGFYTLKFGMALVKTNEIALGSSRRPTSGQNSGVEQAMNNAADVLMESLEKTATLAIVNVSSNDRDLSEFITNELEFLLVSKRFKLVDRSELDMIRKEQNFQLSGDVDDKTIAAIGKFAGANIVITGAVTGTGETRRLRLRALNTQTAQVMAVASERL